MKPLEFTITESNVEVDLSSALELYVEVKVAGQVVKVPATLVSDGWDGRLEVRLPEGAELFQPVICFNGGLILGQVIAIRAEPALESDDDESGTEGRDREATSRERAPQG